MVQYVRRVSHSVEVVKCSENSAPSALLHRVLVHIVQIEHIVPKLPIVIFSYRTFRKLVHLLHLVIWSYMSLQGPPLRRRTISSLRPLPLNPSPQMGQCMRDNVTAGAV